MTMRLPDPLKWVGKMGVKTAYNTASCWRVNVSSKEWDDSIGVSHILITPEDQVLEEVSKRFKLRKLTLYITSTDQIISRARKCQVKAYYFDIFEYIFDLFFSFLLF